MVVGSGVKWRETHIRSLGECLAQGAPAKDAWLPVVYAVFWLEWQPAQKVMAHVSRAVLQTG